MIAHRLIRHSGNNNTNANGTNRSSASEKTYECDVCMKTFNKHSSWWKHKKCHTGERAYKCYICEKAFTQQANLHRVRQQKAINAHSIDFSLSFLSESWIFHSLSSHPFRSPLLSQHMFVHSGEKPHACKICDKRFSQAANLVKHQVIHTSKCSLLRPQQTRPSDVSYFSIRSFPDEKPFACKLCPKQFTQRANLKKHEMVHTGK